MELLQQADELGKSFKITEVEYGHRNSDVDSGEWYSLSYKQAKLIQALADELRGKEWQDISMAPDPTDDGEYLLISNGYRIQHILYNKGGMFGSGLGEALMPVDTITLWKYSDLPQPPNEDK